MDIGFKGIIILWLALLWPIVAVMLFVRSKSSYVKNNTAFFVIGFLLAYLFGYVFCYSIIYVKIILAAWVRNTFGLSEYALAFLRYIPVVIILGMPIAINHCVFFAFRKMKYQRYKINKK